MYSSLSTSSTGELKHGYATLVGENGLNSVFVLSIPLILTLSVGIALRLHVKRRAMAVAWTLSGLLALFNFAAMWAIGLYVIPVTICLFHACSRYSLESTRQNVSAHGISYPGCLIVSSCL
jgi:hypothetical protein